MKDIVIGLLSDCISYASNGAAVTGAAGAVASTAIGRMMQKRHEVLREIIRTEIRQGNFEGVDQDELTSVFFRLIRDAQEGVAKNNLHLMARVINGMAEKKELTAPTFLKYANVLASLTEQEIIVLGIMAKYLKNPALREEGKTHPLEVIDREKEELKATVHNYAAVQQSMVRTGLVYFSVNSQTMDDFVLDGGDFSGNPGSVQMTINSKVVYQLTPLMSEIVKYTDFILKTEIV